VTALFGKKKGARASILAISAAAAAGKGRGERGTAALGTGKGERNDGQQRRPSSASPLAEDGREKEKGKSFS